MHIRPARPEDFTAMWPIFQQIVASGTTYVFAPDTSYNDARAYWFAPGISSYVATDGEQIAGMYKIVANQRDLGAHVANASFMVAPAYSGRGIGKLMGMDCLRNARRAGFSAMQFNIVVSTNQAAVALWQKLGFEIVGTLPGAFRHAQLGFVDAYVMFRSLDDVDVSSQPDC